MEERINIKAANDGVLEGFLAAWGQPSFRLRQITSWLFAKNVEDFSHMNNLPLDLRQKLAATFYIPRLKLHHEASSLDGSTKYIFELQDQGLIESVLIPSQERLTACISSQVGCSLDCVFCATGYLPYKRNLHAYEIYEQVYLLSQIALQRYGKKLDNIVYMGMGEPPLNYKNLLQSFSYITSPSGLGLSTRRITVSTAGLPKLINKLAKDNPKIRLAISLHACRDEKRTKIMSVNAHTSIEELRQSIANYYRITKNTVTLEYILFHGFNDLQADAEALADFATSTCSKVNLIEYNPIAHVSSLVPASRNRIHFFQRVLESRRIISTIRYSKGADISAACGQLATKVCPA